MAFHSLRRPLQLSAPAPDSVSLVVWDLRTCSGMGFRHAVGETKLLDPREGPPTQNSIVLPFVPICALCGKPVPLEISNTDERGRAVHEECYARSLHLDQKPEKRSS